MAHGQPGRCAVAAAVGGSSEGRAAARRLASSVVEVHGEFIMPTLADFVLYSSDGWDGVGSVGSVGSAEQRAGFRAHRTKMKV